MVGPALGTRLELLGRLAPVVPAAILLTMSTAAKPQEERANFFDDPFLQVTAAITDCPKEPGPSITRAEMLND